MVNAGGAAAAPDGAGPVYESFTRPVKVLPSMSLENWILIGDSRSASVSPAVGVLKTTSGTGWGGGGTTTSATASLGAVASAMDVASIQGSAPSRRSVPATLSQRPVSIRELT